MGRVVCGLFGVWVVWCFGCQVCLCCFVCGLFGLWVVWCVCCVLCVLFGVLLCGVRVVYRSICDMFNICFEFLDVCHVQLEVEQS